MAMRGRRREQQVVECYTRREGPPAGGEGGMELRGNAQDEGEEGPPPMEWEGNGTRRNEPRQ